jgi:hypothetical protein
MSAQPARPATSSSTQRTDSDERQQTAVVPFERLVQEAPALNPAARGQHPRVFFRAAEVARLRERARLHPAAWQAFLQHAAGLHKQPPEPPAQGRGEHYAAGLALPEPAFAYAIDRDPQHLEQARRWIRAVMAYEPWGYTYNKPDQDIPAAFLLYGLTFSYDLLAADLAPAERDAVRAKIAEKATRLYDAYRFKPGKRYTFSQNHTFINAAAFGLAGMALAGEHPDAERWVALARAIFDRTVRTYSPDGYYYEGYHYFEFSVPWIIHFLDALEHNTSERWYERLRLDLAKLYVAHSLLPNGDIVDFGDAGTGAAGRLAHDRDVLGSQALLYRIAARYHDPLSAAVADYASQTLHLPDREPLWTFIWRDPAAAGATTAANATSASATAASATAASVTAGATASLDAIPLVHHFPNADVVFARTSWRADATAFAFKCGPPEGHAARALATALPEWRQNMGHAHPDAGSFIIFARGHYLTGDAGYTGVKMTADHNTLLIDGHGQADDGHHEVFNTLTPAALDAIKIVHVDIEGIEEDAARTRAATTAAAAATTTAAASDGRRTGRSGRITIEADGTTAYAPSLGIRHWQRTFTFDGRDTFDITDRITLDRAAPIAWLLHADRGLSQRDATTFAIAATAPAAAATAADAALIVDTHATPHLTARIAPHIVVTQGRPGSVEDGEREARGQVLTLTTAPTTQADIRITLRVQEPSHDSH